MNAVIIKYIVCLLLTILLGIVIYIINELVHEQERKKVKNEEEINNKLLEEKIIEYKEKSEKWNREIQSKISNTNTLNCYKSNREIKVIIGDYNKLSAIHTNSILKSMGISTFVVPTAFDIISRINSGEKYDIILTNNIYQEGSGEQILNSLKEKEKFNIPIIILTTDQNARNHYVDDLGFDEYIPKLLDSNKVIQVFPRVVSNLKFSKEKGIE